MTVHPTAIVEDGAEIGAGAEIGPFCFIERGAKLGEGVRLISHVVVHGAAEIGARTLVHPHAVLGGEGQIRHPDPAVTHLVVGADCVIRESVTLNRGSPRDCGVTRIGDRCYFMAYAHIGHDCQLENDVMIANGAAISGHVKIGEGAIISGLAAIQQFSRIGRFAFVGGLTGVTEDIIPYGMAIGERAELTGLNLIGLKRRGVPRANIHALRAAFRAIFQSDAGSLAERARSAAETWPQFPEVQDVVAFILADSKQPICTARRRSRSVEEE